MYLKPPGLACAKSRFVQ